jgi:Mg2+-importing ATPase
VRATAGAAAWLLFARQFTSPLVLILVGAAAIAWLVGERGDAVTICAIVIASGLVGWWQERSAGAAVRALLDRVALQTAVLRDGRERPLPVDSLVPGDVVKHWFFRRWETVDRFAPR